ncbi:hypothetical protein HG536_0H01800 [Torulaspora globosa]|uniref:Riboflavin kinase n=1 Tax=Torulaspora globosa TaxID=48254 RepID=A0A7G3ZMR9_9SACH|nr:uncharacterized protein HG536_0H01800 [Torulaspora globosa]QLL34805.1 hypothetical protein HG536_0H01800 [Torulaspora globosa]
MTRRAADSPIPDKPEDPFPLVTDYCDIVGGFGRGSAELGIPTANIPVNQLPKAINDLELGVYFGFAKLRPVDHGEEVFTRKNGAKVLMNYGRNLDRQNGDLDPMPVVLSVGKNPFYGNDFKTVELHIIHEFKDSFYGAQVKFSILGHIRPELNYTTKEALIEDINIDILTALEALEMDSFKVYRSQLAD